MSTIQEDFGRFYKVYNHANGTPFHLYNQIKDAYIYLMLSLSEERNRTSHNDFQENLESLKRQFQVYRIAKEYDTLSIEESLKLFSIKLDEFKTWLKMDEDSFVGEFSEKERGLYPDLFDLINIDEEDLSINLHSEKSLLKPIEADIQSNLDSVKDRLFRKFSRRELYSISSQIENFFMSYYAVKLWKFINHNDQSTADHKKTDKDRIWFKVGNLFAKGDPYELRKKDPNIPFREMAIHFGFSKSTHPYFSNSFGNISKSDKNIFSSQEKIQTIKSYCKKNGIDPCDRFNSECEQFKEKYT